MKRKKYKCPKCSLVWPIRVSEVRNYLYCDPVEYAQVGCGFNAPIEEWEEVQAGCSMGGDQMPQVIQVGAEPFEGLEPSEEDAQQSQEGGGFAGELPSQNPNQYFSLDSAYLAGYSKATGDLGKYLLDRPGTVTHPNKSNPRLFRLTLLYILIYLVAMGVIYWCLETPDFRAWLIDSINVALLILTHHLLLTRFK